MRGAYPSVHDVDDLAGFGFDQRGATIDDDVLIPVRQCVFGELSWLEYIRYDGPEYQFKVGRTLDDDGIRFHVFADYDLLLGRNHSGLGSCESGSSEKNIALIVVRKGICTSLGLTRKIASVGRNGSKPTRARLVLLASNYPGGRWAVAPPSNQPTFAPGAPSPDGELFAIVPALYRSLATSCSCRRLDVWVWPQRSHWGIRRLSS